MAIPKNEGELKLSRRKLLKSGVSGLSGLILAERFSGFALAQQAQQTGLGLSEHQIISDMCDQGASMASDAKGKAWIAALRQLDDGTQQIITSDLNGKWSKFRPITKEGSYSSRAAFSISKAVQLTGPEEAQIQL
ncbi:MAG: hypothetical protein ACYSSI_12385 [Planctomycetota bacterium]